MNIHFMNTLENLMDIYYSPLYVCTCIYKPYVPLPNTHNIYISPHPSRSGYSNEYTHTVIHYTSTLARHVRILHITHSLILWTLVCPSSWASKRRRDLLALAKSFVSLVVLGFRPISCQGHDGR